MKKVLSLILTTAMLLSLTACGDELPTFDEDMLDSMLDSIQSQPEVTESSVTTPLESDMFSETPTIENTISVQVELLSFVLTAGEQGEYGKLVTYNKGTEFEETFYAFYIPEGTYTVTNKGKYMSQVSIYSDETYITDYGWEEYVNSFDAKLLDVGASDIITVEKGQHIEIHEPAVFEFTQHQ